MKKEIEQQFVETWGAMGSLWGVNTSVARVHALLMVSEKPLGLDDISGYLCISRGNASMCLKELRSWGVIKKIREAGDRRDFYESENDVWTMFIRIIRERKKRELDPAIDAVKQVISSIDNDTDEVVRNRFGQMNDLVDTLGAISESFLASEEGAKAALFMASNMMKERE